MFKKNDINHQLNVGNIYTLNYMKHGKILFGGEILVEFIPENKEFRNFV